MALRIETFSNRDGGNAFFKAIGHPLAGPPQVPGDGDIAGPVTRRLRDAYKAMIARDVVRRGELN